MVSKVIILVLVLLSSYLGWLFYESENRRKSLEFKLNRSNSLINDLEKQVFSLEEKMTKVREESVEGVIEDASKTMMDVWRSVIDSVEQELDSVEDKLKEYKEEFKGQENPSGSSHIDNKKRT